MHFLIEFQDGFNVVDQPTSNSTPKINELSKTDNLVAGPQQFVGFDAQVNNATGKIENTKNINCFENLSKYVNATADNATADKAQIGNKVFNFTDIRCSSC